MSIDSLLLTLLAFFSFGGGEVTETDIENTWCASSYLYEIYPTEDVEKICVSVDLLENENLYIRGDSSNLTGNVRYMEDTTYRKTSKQLSEYPDVIYRRGWYFDTDNKGRHGPKEWYIDNNILWVYRMTDDPPGKFNSLPNPSAWTRYEINREARGLHTLTRVLPDIISAKDFRARYPKATVPKFIN